MENQANTPNRNPAHNQVNDVLSGAMENLKTMVDSNTVIGERIVVDETTTIIPISKINFGFASGGSEIPTKTEKTPFGGGAGGAVTITPVAFLVISNGDVRMLQVSTAVNTADRVVDMVPQVVDKVQELIANHKDKKKAQAPDFSV